MSEEAASYTCPKCGRTSYNPNDVANKYCGYCHEFEEDEMSDEPRPAIYDPEHYLADAQTEIARLKDELKMAHEVVQNRDAEIERLRGLIARAGGCNR